MACPYIGFLAEWVILNWSNIFAHRYEKHDRNNHTLRTRRGEPARPSDEGDD